MSGPSDAWNDVEIGELVKSTEQAIQNGLQRFPGDSYLLFTESRLARLLADDDRAEAAVQAAFDRNATNAFVASRLAKLQVDRGRIPDAIRTFETSLSAGVNDRQIHFGYAKLLLDNQLGTADEITYHLRRGFTEGDSNVEAQYWYARQLYVNGDIADAQARFRDLRDLPIDPVVKRAIRGEIVDGDDARRFSGAIDRVEFNFAFVVRDGENDAIYLHRIGCPPATWDSLRRGSRIWFSIGFNFWGATAFDVALQ